MTCCAADITYCGLVAKIKPEMRIENGGWYDIEATVDIRFSRLYGKKGPVYYVTKATPAEPPAESVATFY